MMNKKYLRKKYGNPLPRLEEKDRIYLKVPYTERTFAKYCRCSFDTEKKLWFTGAYNFNLDILVELYGVDEHTSDNAQQLLEMALGTPDREELMEKIREHYRKSETEDEGTGRKE